MSSLTMRKYITGIDKQTLLILILLKNKISIPMYANNINLYNVIISQIYLFAI